MSVGAGFFMLWLWDVFFVLGCDIGALAWVWTRTGRRNEREGCGGSDRHRVIEGAELRLKARAQGVGFWQREGRGVLGVGRAGAWSTRLRSTRLGHAQARCARLRSTRFGCAQARCVRMRSTRLGCAQAWFVRMRSTRLGHAQARCVRMRFTRLGHAQAWCVGRIIRTCT